MNFSERHSCISAKIANYFDELAGLNGATLSYQLGFGVLLIILLPVLLFEILLVFLFGIDIRVFVPRSEEEPLELHEEEVPESLQHLIPLARKFGVGDDGDRGDIMKTATPEELIDLRKKVEPKAQEIADWLSTFPESKISDTASFFLYLGSACDEVPIYESEKET